MTKLFEAPYCYWIGLDTPTGAPADVEAFNEFYDNVHVPEVLAANEGMIAASRFELVRPDPRGDFGPRWLAVYELADDHAATEYVRRNSRGAADRPDYSAGPQLWQDMTPRWRVIWKRTVEVGEASRHDCQLLFTVGMSVPESTSPGDLAQFNEFYNSVHLSEVMRWGGFARACRFALHESLLHPQPGAPMFCATYESAGAAPFESSASAPAPAFTDGPPAWEARDTRWRLMYRQLTRTTGGNGR